jgi:hypothetical protein
MSETIEYKKDWAKSEAKKMLLEDIVSGRIDGWQPKQVYEDPARHDLYKYYKRENFSTNLRNLREYVKNHRARAATDSIAMAETRRELANHRNPNAAPRWDGTRAQAILQRLIANGETANKKPAEIRASKPEFLVYTGEQFRNHLTHKKRRLYRRDNSNEFSQHMKFLQSKIKI